MILTNSRNSIPFTSSAPRRVANGLQLAAASGLRTRHYTGFFRIIGLLLVTLLLGFKPGMSTSDESLVFRQVHVLSMSDEGISAGYTVVVQRGVITWVGPSDTDRDNIPAGARVVDGGGSLYLMPGLAEMHAHIPPASQGEAWTERVLTMYLTQGVTTIRGMLGEPSHLELRRRAEAGELVSPRIFTSGPSFNGNSAPDPETARSMVRAQAEAGYDLLKLHPGLSEATFEAIADEARRVGIEFSGHISHAVGLERTLASGKITIDHLDRYMEFLSGDAGRRPDPSIIYFGYDLARAADTSRISEAVSRTKAAGIWNVPTNTLLENVFNPDLTLEVMRAWPGVDMVPAQTLAGWTNFITILRNQPDYDPEKARQFLQHRRMLTLALHEGGTGLLLGSDAPQIFNPPGYSLHRELALLVASGLSPYEAIRTGTVHVGQYLAQVGHADVPVGQVAAGFRADLLLLDRNPLENLPFGDGIVGVLSNGIYYDEASLTELRQRLTE